MKHIILIKCFFLFLCVKAFSQNPYKYESMIITASTAKGDNDRLYTTASTGGFTNTRVQNVMTSTAFDINKVISFNGDYSGTRIKLQQAVELIMKNMNSKGYELKSSLGNPTIEGVGTVTLFFEKSSSYREAELYKLINELTTRIDTTTKKYTELAMVRIQTNVLNYLKSIPNEVITQAYKDELTKMIMAEADDKIKEMIDELKKEIRNSSTENN